MIRLYAEGKKYQALCQELKDAQSQLDKCNRLLKKGKTAFRSTSVSNANKEVLDIISEMKELKTQICNSDEFKKLDDRGKEIYTLYFFNNETHTKIETTCNLSRGNLCRTIRHLCFNYIRDLYEVDDFQI